MLGWGMQFQNGTFENRIIFDDADIGLQKTRLLKCGYKLANRWRKVFEEDSDNEESHDINDTDPNSFQCTWTGV